MEPTFPPPAAVPDHEPATRRAVPDAELATRRAGNRALVVIGMFKLCKALLFFAASFGIFKMLHKDTSVELTKLVHVLRIDGDRAFVKNLLLKANLIDDPKKKIISGLAAFYAILFSIEGIGLVTRKTWGEYFAIIITSTGIPLELYEIFHRTAHKANSQLISHVPEDQRPGFVFNQFFFLKLAVLLGNVAIVWYLIHHLRRNAHRHKLLAATEAATPVAAPPLTVPDREESNASAPP